MPEIDNQVYTGKIKQKGSVHGLQVSVLAHVEIHVILPCRKEGKSKMTESANGSFDFRIIQSKVLLAVKNKTFKEYLIRELCLCVQLVLR